MLHDNLNPKSSKSDNSNSKETISQKKYIH